MEPNILPSGIVRLTDWGVIRAQGPDAAEGFADGPLGLVEPLGLEGRLAAQTPGARRHIRERMTEFCRRLDAVEKQRELRRKSREKNEIPIKPPERE